MFTFDSVESAIKAIDPNRRFNELKLAGGFAEMTASIHDLSQEQIEQDCSSLMDFIRSGELKRELESELAEGGRIDLTPNPKTDPLTIGEDFSKLDPVPALKRLYQRWSARKAAR